MSNWFWIGPTLAAILTFVGYALFKYLQGEFNPGLSLNYSHSRVSISPGYSLWFIEVEAYNSSKVPVTVRYMETSLRRISRYTDEDVQDLIVRSTIEGGSLFQAVPWEHILSIPRQWDQGDCTIQPGERHFEVFEFIIPNSYDTIPLQVEMQVVNKPMEEDQTFRQPVIAWRKMGIITPTENTDES